MIKTVLVDSFCDLQVGFADIVKQFGKFQTDRRFLLEQQFLKHRLVDGDYLPKM
jgi:hypothetical protein